MVAPRSFRTFVGTVALGFVAIQAYRWFGPIALVLVCGIGLTALLALTYYWADLETP
jgi:hypothetical protein